VLGLDQQVEREPHGVGRRVGDDRALGRARGDAGVHHAREQAFGRGHPAAAGPEQLDHGRDARRAPREGGQRLDAADPVDLVRPAEARGEQGGGIAVARGVGRADHHDARNARDARGHGHHVGGGGEAAPAPGHVQPDRGYGPGPLARVHAGPDLRQGHGPGKLRLVTPAHVLRARPDGVLHDGRQRALGLVDLRFRDAERKPRDVRVVERAAVLHERRVAPCPHPLEDGAHGLDRVADVAARPGEEARAVGRAEILPSYNYNVHWGHSTEGGAASSMKPAGAFTSCQAASSVRPPSRSWLSTCRCDTQQLPEAEKSGIHDR
jgi:hypothetical protein